MAAITPAKAKNATKAYRLWLKLHYPLYFWYAAGAFIGALAILHAVSLLRSYLRLRRVRSASASSPATLRSGGILDAIKTAANIVFFRVSLPLRSLHRMNLVEMFVTTGYFAAVITWDLVNSQNNLNAVWWANRAGHMATTQVPLIVALAGKNNVISFFTGLSHEKLNVIHRAAARACLICIWVHAWGRWSLGLKDDLEEPEIRWGVVSMTAISLATVLSLRPLRNIAYEVFLIGHIILILIFIAAACIHRPMYKERVYPALVLWGFDRLLRVGRLIYLNTFCSPSPPVVSTVSEKKITASLEIRDAIVTHVSSDTVRLTVRRRRAFGMTWKSGQHIYLILPGVSLLPFEAHPFTPASIPHSLTNDNQETVDIEFIIRGRDGFTKRLLDYAVARDVEEGSPDGKEVKVLLDGPYGQPPNLALYDSVVLIAGGSGVSYTISTLLDLVYRAQRNETSVRRALFVWVVRSADHVAWIAPSLKNAIATCPPSLDIDIRVFVTKGNVPHIASTPMSSSSSQNKVSDHDNDSVEKVEDLDPIDINAIPYHGSATNSQMELTSMRGFTFQSGRPDIESLLREEIATLPAGSSSSVDVCGPQALSTSVRHALTVSDIAGPGAVLKGRPKITLHTETFGW